MRRLVVTEDGAIYGVIRALKLVTEELAPETSARRTLAKGVPIAPTGAPTYGAAVKRDTGAAHDWPPGADPVGEAPLDQVGNGVT